MSHEVEQERSNGHRRWVCHTCTWATQWTTYTLPEDGAAAVRHTIQGDP